MQLLVALRVARPISLVSCVLLLPPSSHQLSANTHQDIHCLLTGGTYRHPAISATATAAARTWALSTRLLGVAGSAGSLAPHSVPTARACAQARLGTTWRLGALRACPGYRLGLRGGCLKMGNGLCCRWHTGHRASQEGVSR